jgi:hypothetical protein
MKNKRRTYEDYDVEGARFIRVHVTIEKETRDA